MKKIFTTLFAAAALVSGIQAQTAYNMKLHFADGTSKVYHVQDVDSVTFSEAIDYSSLNFDIKIADITSHGATTTIKCNNANVLWYNDAFEKEYFDYYTLEELAQEQLDYMYEDWVEFEEDYKAEYGDDITFADFFYPGYYVDEYTYDYLDPSTEYVIVAFGVDLETMEVVGIPDTLSFTTLAPEPSDNIISFSFANDTLYINTTNDDQYFWNSFLPEDLEDYGAETYTEAWDIVAAEMDAYGLMDYFISAGSEANAVKSYFTGMPGTHTIVAAGWDGVRTTDYFVYELTLTEDQVGSGEDFEFELAPAKKVKTVVKQTTPAKHTFRSAKHFPLVK